jgi:hypothetical protein
MVAVCGVRPKLIAKERLASLPDVERTNEGRSAQTAGRTLGFDEGDGTRRRYKTNRDQMFGSEDRDGGRRHRQLRLRDDTLGQGDLRGVWMWHLVRAEVAVQCRQQHSAEHHEERGFQ